MYLDTGKYLDMFLMQIPCRVIQFVGDLGDAQVRLCTTYVSMNITKGNVEIYLLYYE